MWIWWLLDVYIMFSNRFLTNDQKKMNYCEHQALVLSESLAVYLFRKFFYVWLIDLFLLSPSSTISKRKSNMLQIVFIHASFKWGKYDCVCLCVWFVPLWLRIAESPRQYYNEMLMLVLRWSIAIQFSINRTIEYWINEYWIFIWLEFTIWVERSYRIGSLTIIWIHFNYTFLCVCI